MDCRLLQNEIKYWDEVNLELKQIGGLPDLRVNQQIKCDDERLYHSTYLFCLFYSDLLNLINNELKLFKEQKSFLEIGCGTGKIALELARMGHRVVGVDVSQASISIARDYYNYVQRKENISGTIQYHCCDFNSFNMEGSNFDYIISLNSLHHLHSLEKIVDKMERLLIPDATSKVIIVESFDDQRNILRNLIQNMLSLIIPRKHFARSMINIFKRTGSLLQGNGEKEMNNSSGCAENYEQHNDYAKVISIMNKYFTVMKEVNLFSFSSPIATQLPYNRFVRGFFPVILLQLDKLLMNLKMCKSEVKMVVFGKRNNVFTAGK